MLTKGKDLLLGKTRRPYVCTASICSASDQQAWAQTSRAQHPYREGTGGGAGSAPVPWVQFMSNDERSHHFARCRLRRALALARPLPVRVGPYPAPYHCAVTGRWRSTQEQPGCKARCSVRTEVRRSGDGAAISVTFGKCLPMLATAAWVF